MRNAAALLAAIALPVAAAAAPTGLNLVPTADVVPWRQLTVQLQNGNTEVSGRRSVIHQPDLVVQSQVGLPYDCEAGIDVLPSDPPYDYRPAVNFKWTPVAEGDRWPATAVGVQGLGVGFAPSFYAVATKTINYDQIQYQKFRAHHRNIKLRGIRLHAGILRAPNAWRAILGTDVEVNDHFVFYADWTSGPANAVSLGGVIVLDRANSIGIALLRGNTADRVSGALVTLTHTFAW